jgi:hypothetical protein
VGAFSLADLFGGVEVLVVEDLVAVLAVEVVALAEVEPVAAGRATPVPKIRREAMKLNKKALIYDGQGPKGVFRHQL